MISLLLKTKLMKNMNSNLFRPSASLTINSVYRLSWKKPTFRDNKRRQKNSEEEKKSVFLNIALGCFVFALCFAGIPIYRTFCEHMGLVGDSNKKQYHFAGRKINNMKKFKVKFSGEGDPDVNWEFEPVEKEVVVGAAETAIVFYRLYNKEDRPIVGFSTYNISPEECNLYFSKIQCFCFNQQLINPKEELLLPLFFYLEPEINEDSDVCRVENILVAYTFLKSAKQNLAKFAEEELKKVEENKIKLNQIRASKLHMTLDQYLLHLQTEKEKEALGPTPMNHSEEVDRLRHIRDFQEDLLKADLISQNFQINQPPLEGDDAS